MPQTDRVPDHHAIRRFVAQTGADNAAFTRLMERLGPVTTTGAGFGIRELEVEL